MSLINNNIVWHALKRFTINHTRTLSSLPDVVEVFQRNEVEEHRKKSSVLETCDEEQVSHVAPYLKPTFNFAAYVNKSEVLQELLKLGVDLHQLEKKKDVPEFILRLKFDNDIKAHVMFLHHLGLNTKEIGVFITKNPFIFKESLDNLKVRINYLESKRFTPQMILRIISRNAFWLSFTVKAIDDKLGYFQGTFSLIGDEVRALATRQPKLITYNENHIQKSLFTVEEQMGFTPEEYKAILLNKPGIFMMNHEKLLETFEYLHGTMKISLEMIAHMPGVLTCRVFRLRQRFEYLQTLNKVQFNPKEPSYISPLLIATGTDEDFVANVAKTSIQSYNTFLKTL